MSEKIQSMFLIQTRWLLESGTVTLTYTSWEIVQFLVVAWSINLLYGLLRIIVRKLNVFSKPRRPAVIYVNAMLPDPNHSSSYLETLPTFTFRQFVSRSWEGRETVLLVTRKIPHIKIGPIEAQTDTQGRQWLSPQPKRKSETNVI